MFTNSLTHKSDEELAKLTRDWDKTAFEMIYERWKDKTYSYLRNLLNYNKTDTDTVATDTFIKLFEYIKKQPVENVKSLIYRIAHNTAIDHIRSKQSENINDFQDEKVEIIHDHHDTQKKENINSKYKQEIIQQFLSKLDTQSRDILYLYYQEEKSYDEIAIIHESNKNTVWTAIFNAKKKLQDMLSRAGLENIIEL